MEVKRASAAETPASKMADFVAEHVTYLMTLGGMESIGAQRYTCGFGTRLHVSFSPFKDAPSDIVKQGIVMKDAIAQIMSVANIVQITMNPNDDDVRQMKDMWERLSTADKAGDKESIPEDAPEGAPGNGIKVQFESPVENRDENAD